MTSLVSTIRSEIHWLNRRKAFKGAAIFSALLTLVVVFGRVFSTNDDVAAAIRKAENEVAQSLQNGIDLPIAGVYQDPRYHVASQMPEDIAIIAVGIAVFFLLAALLSIGGDWRSGTVALSFESVSQRAQAAISRSLAWSFAAISIAFICTGVATAGLIALGNISGFAGGVTISMVVGPLWRTLLVVAAAVAIGSFIGTALRSDISGAILFIAYLLVCELVLSGLLKQSGYRSPAERLFQFVEGIAPLDVIDINCGQVPSCPVVYGQANPDIIMIAVLGSVCIFGIGLSALAARRSMWR